MKSFYFILGSMLIIVCLMAAGTIEAQEAASLKVTEAVICEDVIDRAPVNAGSSFSVSVGQLFCFTKIEGAKEPTTITHVWCFGEMERARVELSVGAASWRTHSSKKIQPHEIGTWHVDVLGPQGELLQALEFQVTPQQHEVPKDLAFNVLEL
jgi:hypothetical protein